MGFFLFFLSFKVCLSRGGFKSGKTNSRIVYKRVIVISPSIDFRSRRVSQFRSSSSARALSYTHTYQTTISYNNIIPIHRYIICIVYTPSINRSQVGVDKQVCVFSYNNNNICVCISPTCIQVQLSNYFYSSIILSRTRRLQKNFPKRMYRVYMVYYRGVSRRGLKGCKPLQKMVD